MQKSQLFSTCILTWMHDTHAADRRRRDGAIEMLEVHDGNLLDLQVWESVIITKVFDLLKTDSSCFCCD